MNIIQILSSRDNISGEQIAKSLNISRAAVHKKIIKLRKLGYKIIGQKNQGYTLLSKPDILSAEEINNYISNDTIFNQDVFYFSKTDSTQTVAKRYANKGAKQGTLVIAEEQSSGYGRLKRKWFSPKGGIWLSFILKPNILPEKVPQITLLLSISICRALKNLFKIKSYIKWPNDIIVNNKKLAGILTEMSAEVGRVNWIVTGLGLNANNIIPKTVKKQAVSLIEVIKNKINRPQLTAEILKIFNELYNKFCNYGFQLFEKEYNNISYLKNKKIKLSYSNNVFKGRALNIDKDGYLWMKLIDGKKMKMISGEVLP